jgi:hypothetical protein
MPAQAAVPWGRLLLQGLLLVLLQGLLLLVLLAVLSNQQQCLAASARQAMLQHRELLAGLMAAASVRRLQVWQQQLPQKAQTVIGRMMWQQQQPGMTATLQPKG